MWVGVPPPPSVVRRYPIGFELACRCPLWPLRYIGQNGSWSKKSYQVMAEAKPEDAVQQRRARRAEAKEYLSMRFGTVPDSTLIEPKAIVEVGKAVLTQLIESAEGGVAPARETVSILLGRHEHAHSNDAVAAPADLAENYVI